MLYNLTGTGLRNTDSLDIKAIVLLHISSVLILQQFQPQAAKTGLHLPALSAWPSY